jgi:hypothetical protein
MIALMGTTGRTGNVPSESVATTLVFLPSYLFEHESIVD